MKKPTIRMAVLLVALAAGVADAQKKLPLSNAAYTGPYFGGRLDVTFVNDTSVFFKGVLKMTSGQYAIPVEDVPNGMTTLMTFVLGATAPTVSPGHTGPLIQPNTPVSGSGNFVGADGTVFTVTVLTGVNTVTVTCVTCETTTAEVSKPVAAYGTPGTATITIKPKKKK